MVDKSQALYLHAPKGDYDCDDCAAFLTDTHRCTIHSPDTHISPDGSCGYFMPGWPGALGYRPLSLVTVQQSGYVDDVNGASCKRCVYWSAEGWDCLLVDKDSVGDDPGMIHPEACCCLWRRDPERGSLSDATFDQQGWVEKEA